MIEVCDLHYRYGSKDGAESESGSQAGNGSGDRPRKNSAIDALSGVRFTAQAGQITAVLGPNGSGKSTCFKLLSTQLTLDRGDARVCGVSLRSDPDKVRSLLAVTFQNPALDPWLTVEENLHVHRSLWAQSQTLPQPGSREDDDERVLKLLGVSELRRRRVKTLSGGQARRVELCKVLMGGPRVLLLDEPTTGLDPSARHDFWSALSELKNQSMTILVTTHLFEEAALADHLVFLSAGQVADAFDLKGLSSRQVARFSALRSDGPEAEFQLRSNIEKLVSDFGLKSRWQGAECFVDLAKFEQSADLLRGLSRFGAFHFQVGAWSLADLYFEKTGKTLK